MYTLDFKMSTRGWCYMLEPYGLSKGDFEKTQNLITDLRKIGYLPLDIVSEDTTRIAEGVEELDTPDPGAYAESLMDSLRSWITGYRPISFWEGQEYYLELLVEKNDLRSVFSPICRQFCVAITNGKGWCDVNARAAFMQRFKKHELAGRQGILLYCGDHDPDGLRISSTLHNNLAELSDSVGWDPRGLIIERFGLNYDFIEAHGLSWIDGLETGRNKGSLADPRHPSHNLAYVQDYLRRYGGRKVESNALVIAPEAGRRLCLEAITKYVPAASIRLYRDALAPYVAQVTEAIRNMVVF